MSEPLDPILHSIEAEQAVLGALMHDNSLLADLPALNADHFAETIHARLFDDISEMVKAGRVADPLSLRTLYANRFSEIGGAGYLLKLVQARPGMVAHTIEYARQLANLATRRAVWTLLADAQFAARDGMDGEALREFLEKGARDLASGGIIGPKGLEAAMASASDAMDTDGERGLATGWRDLDQRLGGIFPGNLVLIAGRPGMGKSSFGANLARGWAYRDRRGHFASYEMSALELGERSLGAAANVTYADIRRNPRAINRDLITDALARAPKSLLIDDTPAQTVAQLEASVRRSKRRLGGLDFVIVDYLQLMKTTGHHPSLTSKITEISQDLKAMAKRLHVPVIALSQMSRASESRAGADRRPQLSDLRDSGSLEQDADVVIGLHRPEYYLQREEPEKDDDVLAWKAKLDACANLLEVITLKQRQGPTGIDILTCFLETDRIVDRVPVNWRQDRRS